MEYFQYHDSLQIERIENLKTLKIISWKLPSYRPSTRQPVMLNNVSWPVEGQRWRILKVLEDRQRKPDEDLQGEDMDFETWVHRRSRFELACQSPDVK